jgi:nickel/cobalt exporter
MIERIACFIYGLALFLSKQVQASPFTDGQPTAPAASVTLGTLPSPFLREILLFQRQIHDAMTTQITALRDGQSLMPLWMLLGISFAYGVFHVLAPGHGKVIVGAYFMGNRARWRDAFSAGIIMAVGHTITAVGIVVALYLILGIGQLQLMADARYFELVGYGMICMVGLWLLLRGWRGAPTCSHCRHDHSHNHHNHDHHEHEHAHHHHETTASSPAPLMRNKHALSLFAATSLVPCTGSMIILLFTLAQQILWAGLLAVLAIALGMAVTITVIALTAIILHRGLLGKNNTQQKPWQQKLQRGLSLGAALLVICTGGLLFTGVALDLLAAI